MIFVEYKEDVKYFCDYAFENAALLVQGRARCPCKRCVNREILDKNIKIIYLYRNKFMPNYKH